MKRNLFTRLTALVLSAFAMMTMLLTAGSATASVAPADIATIYQPRPLSLDPPIGGAGEADWRVRRGRSCVSALLRWCVGG
jgi:hypothetical protein